MSFYGEAPGLAIFDPYSAWHVLGILLISLFLGSYLGATEKQLLIFLFVLMGTWELMESQLLAPLNLNFFEAHESWQNKLIGDSVSDLIGYLIYFVGGFSAHIRWQIRGRQEQLKEEALMKMDDDLAREMAEVT